MKKLTLEQINIKAVEIVKEIRLLENVSWPASVEHDYLHKIVAGKKPIISFKYQVACYARHSHALHKLLKLLSRHDPMHVYTANMIQSYINAINMIQSVGSVTFQELSIREYGMPHHKLFGSNFSHLENAKKILKASSEFDHPYISDSSREYNAEELRSFLEKESKELFGIHCPSFVIDKNMTAKASAGKLKIKIREDALFTKYDFNQLLIHEVMTHTLTGLNGSMQSTLQMMGQSAPRTAKTQEGLATFSEIITGNMDLPRLKRLALRVVALEMGMDGANFYDLYDFFIENGQNIKESFLSASRILRGGSADGGIVFTKDGTYLEGLIRIHSLFRWAFKTRNLEITHLLFCGKVDINDLFTLGPAYKAQLITPPNFLPEWYEQLDLLAGKMAFSILLNGIDLDGVENHFSNKLVANAA